jgi:hypothetical protein
MSTPRSFLATVGDVRKGRLQDELAQKYQQLVQQVKDTGRAGTITLTLKVAPLGKEGTMHTVTDEVKVTMPKTDRQTLFFVTEDGDHQLNDPSQPERSLRSVPEAERGKLKEVGNA